MYDSLSDIFNIQCLAAGALGGMVHAWYVEEKATGWDVVKFIIAGAVAANFIAPQVFRLLELSPVSWLFPIGFDAFGVGMSGKHLCLGIEKFFNKFDVLGKTKNE